MFGSGTFVIEATEIAKGVKPGRSRNFSFEKLKNFDPPKWAELKSAVFEKKPEAMFYGFDRDAGAIQRANANAERSGISSITTFSKQSISSLKHPDQESGLVIVNPPYGIRIGDEKKLLSLYQSLGNKLSSEFKGWRFGLVTNSHRLATATGLSFDATVTSFSHGGIKVRLYTASL